MTKPANELKTIGSALSCESLRELAEEVAPATSWGVCLKGSKLLDKVARVLPQLVDEVIALRMAAIGQAQTQDAQTPEDIHQLPSGELGALQALFEKNASETLGIAWWYIHKNRVSDGYCREGFMGIDLHSLWVAFQKAYPTAADFLARGE